MPKKPETPAWSDDEINSFLSSRGHTLAPQGAPAQPGAAGAEEPTGYPPTPGVLDQIRNFFQTGVAPEGRPPTYDEMDWQQAAGRGFARGAASLGLGAAHLAGQMLPTSVRKTLGQATEGIPGVRQLQEFAGTEPEGPAEMAGGGLADLAAGSFVPELGLSRLAARAAPLFRRGVQQVPTYVNPLGAGGRWMMANMPTVTYAPRSHAAAQFAARTADTAAKGALGGALTDPEDPATGAEAGAAAALGGRVAGKGLKSRTGQQIGGWIARHLPTAALGAYEGSGHGTGGMLGGAAAGAALPHVMGVVPRAVTGVTRHYHTIPGRGLQRFGQAVFDTSGRFIGYTAPTTAGMEAGRIAHGDRPVIDVPRRAGPPPPLPEYPYAQPQEANPEASPNR